MRPFQEELSHHEGSNQANMVDGVKLILAFRPQTALLKMLCVGRRIVMIQIPFCGHRFGLSLSFFFVVKHCRKRNESRR
jgi:hypothetical protein